MAASHGLLPIVVSVHHWPLLPKRTCLVNPNQGPVPGPLLQYSENRLPLALKARPDVAAAAQGAVLEI